MNTLIFTTLLLQAAAAALTAAMLLHFRRTYGRGYLQLWGWSWSALAVHHAAAGAAYSMSLVLRPGDWPWIAASSISLIAAGWHIAWMLLGTLAVSGREGLTVPARRRLQVVIGVVALTLVISTVFASPYVRLFVRMGLPALGSVVAFGMLGWVMLRLPRARGSIGAVMLGVAALVYCLVRSVDLAVAILAVVGVGVSPVLAFSGMVDLIMEVTMALGMVVWLLESERSRATTAAQALANSESRFRRLVDHARLIAWEFDPVNKRFTYVSPQAVELLGYPLDHWKQPEFWYRRLHPDDRDAARAYSHAQSVRGEDHEFDYRMCRADGSVVWFRDLTSVDMHEGQVRGLHGVLIDITAQKRIEADLAASEQRYRSLVLSSRDAILVNQDDRFVFCNPAAVRLLGARSHEDIIGRNIYDFIAPESRAAVQDRVRQQREQQATLPMLEERWLSLDGRELEVEVAATPIFFGGAAAIQILGRDISQRKIVDRAIREVEHRLAAVVSAAPVVLWATDANLVFTVSEGSGLTALGLRRGALNGRTIADVYRDVPQIIHNHQRALSGESFSDIVPVGDLVFEARYSPVRDSLGAITGVIGVAVDISDASPPNEPYARAKRDIDLIVEDQTELICRFLPDGTLTFMNDAYCRCFARTREQLVGRPIFDLMEEPYISRLRDLMGRLTPEYPAENIEVCSTMPDSGVRWRSWTDRALFDDQGRLREFQAVGRDITERRASEEALRHSEARFRAIFESAVDPLWDWDIVSDRTMFSPGWARLLEYDRADFDHRADRGELTWEQHVHPDDLPRVRSIIQHALQERSEPYEAEYRLRARSGNWKWVLSRGCVVASDETGQPLRMIGNVSDITERKRSEQALRESEARLRAVIDNTPSVAIQGYDLDGRVLFWNRAAESVFGWSESEAVGKTLDSLILERADAREFRVELEQIRSSGRASQPTEWEFSRRDGTRGWCYSTIFPIPSAVPGVHEPTFICMDVDITQRKHAEQALQHSNELQRLLLSELDHRVRNNLASLTALIDITARDSGSVREFAASIRSRVQAMSVVHALLSREHWRAVDLRQMLVTLAPVATQQAVRLSGPPVEIVPRQATALGMVLQELFANSQKYGALGAPTGVIHVTWDFEDIPPEPDAGPASEHRERAVRLRWRERGGPAIRTSIRPGVGSGLIHGLIRTELRGEAELRFPSDGVNHELLLRVESNDPTPSADLALASVS